MSDYPKQPSKPDLHGYKLQLAMGEGGTGIVYRALNPETGEVVALKEFHANFFRGKSHLRDLTKTVKLFKKLEHPNVARIIDLINVDEHVALILFTHGVLGLGGRRVLSIALHFREQTSVLPTEGIRWDITWLMLNHTSRVPRARHLGCDAGHASLGTNWLMIFSVIERRLLTKLL